MSAPQIHPSAVVDLPCQIGPDTRIWHFCHLTAGCRIGPGCSLGQNVYVGAGVEIGAGVKIQNNVSIYTGVRIADEVFIGPSVVFTNVRTPRAAVPRNTPAGQSPTVVERGATLGANATIVCGVTIGRYALVGAGALVSRDVPAHAVVVGNPARRRGWACLCGVPLLPAEPGYSCPDCGRTATRDGEAWVFEGAAG